MKKITKLSRQLIQCTNKKETVLVASTNRKLRLYNTASLELLEEIEINGVIQRGCRYINNDQQLFFRIIRNGASKYVVYDIQEKFMSFCEIPHLFGFSSSIVVDSETIILFGFGVGKIIKWNFKKMVTEVFENNLFNKRRPLGGQHKVASNRYRLIVAGSIETCESQEEIDLNIDTMQIYRNLVEVDTSKSKRESDNFWLEKFECRVMINSSSLYVFDKKGNELFEYLVKKDCNLPDYFMYNHVLTIDSYIVTNTMESLLFISTSDYSVKKIHICEQLNNSINGIIYISKFKKLIISMGSSHYEYDLMILDGTVSII